MTIPRHSQSGNEVEREAAFLERVQSLPSKPRRRQEKVTMRDLVVKYFPALKVAHERGYTYDDLAVIFEEELGVSISSGTLRKYMAYARTHSADEIELSRLTKENQSK